MSQEWVIIFSLLGVIGVLIITSLLFKQRMSELFMNREKLYKKEIEELKFSSAEEVQKYNKLQDNMNEASRIEDLNKFIQKSLEHIKSFSKFDYVSISLVIHNKIILKVLNIKDDSKINHFNIFCEPGSIVEQWKDKCNYNIHDKAENDILLKIYRTKIKDYVIAVKNTFPEQLSNAAKKYSLTLNNLNEEILDEKFKLPDGSTFKHKDLARVFIPILYRNEYKGKKPNSEENEDTCLGVVEAGYIIKDGQSNENIEKDVSKILSEEVIKRMFIYIDNFAQIWFKNTILITKDEIRNKFAQSRISDQEFLKISLNYIIGEFGLSCGNLCQFSIENNIQLLSKERDVFSDEYTEEEINKLFEINHNINTNGSYANKLGICNEVIKLFQGHESNFMDHTNKTNSNFKKSRNKRNISFNNNSISNEVEYFTSYDNKLKLVVENDTTSPSSYSIPLKKGILSEVGIPILTPENNIIAVCILSSNILNFFNYYHLLIFSEYGKILGARFLTRKRYVSFSELSQPINLFNEEDITKRLLKELREYFGTEAVLLFNIDGDKYKICEKSNEFPNKKFPEAHAGIYFEGADFKLRTENNTINTGYANPTDTQIIVKSIKEIDNRSALYKIGINFKKVLIISFTTGKKYNRVVTIFSKRAVTQDAVNEYADDYIVSIKEKFESAYQMHSILKLLFEHNPNSTKSLFTFIVNQVKKFTNADVVGLIPVDNKSINIKESIIIGESWEKSNFKTFTLSKLILDNGSEIFNTGNEINLYYLKYLNYEIPENDFVKDMNSVYGIRLHYEDKAVKENLAIIMIEYKQSNKFDSYSLEYIKTLEKTLTKIIWNYKQINNDFSNLEKTRKDIEEKNIILNDTIKISEEIIKRKEGVIEGLRTRAAAMTYFKVSRIVHHEIYNLCGKIEDFLDEIKHKSQILDTNISSRIEGILYFIDELLEMTNFSQIEKIFLDVNYEIKSIVKFAKESSIYEIKFLEEYGKNIPELKWNKAEFNMIIYNLISNAEDELIYQKIFNPYIKIKTNFEGNYFTIIIEDNGKGIPKENIEKIFEYTFTTKEEKKGHGIGLYFVKEAINDEKNTNFAEIDVKSTVGKGTKFIIKINININNLD